MKNLLKLFDFDWSPAIRSALNLGGTALVIAGIYMLPIDLSFRLIILGLFSLVLWRTLSV